MGVSVTKYALLYSLYSWPNVILSVFGGYLLDRVFGVRLGTVIFSVFVCLGQVYTYYMYQGWTKVHHSPLLPLSSADIFTWCICGPLLADAGGKICVWVR